MAIYGLQTNFMDTLLKQYFGLEDINTERKDIFVGLGLQQEGANVNIESFDELFFGEPLYGYARARIVFGTPVDGTIANIGDVVFPGAIDNWTSVKDVSMMGLFDTPDAKDLEGNLIKPLAVLCLPQPISIVKGDTIVLSAGVVRLGLSDI